MEAYALSIERVSRAYFERQDERIGTFEDLKEFIRENIQSINLACEGESTRVDFEAIALDSIMLLVQRGSLHRVGLGVFHLKQDGFSIMGAKVRLCSAYLCDNQAKYMYKNCESNVAVCSKKCEFSHKF